MVGAVKGNIYHRGTIHFHVKESMPEKIVGALFQEGGYHLPPIESCSKIFTFHPEVVPTVKTSAFPWLSIAESKTISYQKHSMNLMSPVVPDFSDNRRRLVHLRPASSTCKPSIAVRYRKTGGTPLEMQR